MMTLYFNKNLNHEDLKKFKENPHMYGIKYYPKNATTNSNFGIKDIKEVFHILKIMEVEKIHHRDPLSLIGDIQIMSHEHEPPAVLDKIYYTGYPNTMGPFTVPGTIMGYDPPGGKNFYALSYAWMGASGSGVFGKDGKLLGYVIAIDVGASEFGVQILENVVMIGSVHEVDWNPVLKNIYK